MPEPLIGRDRELEMLDDAVRTATLGLRSVVMITGEAGIGKTRLLEAVAARMSGGRAVWGRTWEVGLTPAYWPWTQVLGALAEPDDPAPAVVELDDRSDAASRLARFDAVAAFLVRRASAHPLAILLDDMHAADPSSMLLLEYIARHVRDARIVVAVTARDGEAAPDVELSLARVRRDARRIAVGRLDAAAVARLVGDRAAPAQIARVQQLSEGNPLFVEELVACISAYGGLDSLAQVTGLRAVIRDRIARLLEPTARALVAGALLGREFRGAILAEVLELPGDELERRLAPAERPGVVTRAGDRYRFSHALVAESLADDLPASEAAQLHLRAARALERHEHDDGASAIAHHLLAASRLDPDHAAPNEAAAAAERAARVAMAQLAFEDAAVLLDRAIAVLPSDGVEARKRRAALLAAQAEALQHAGDHVRGRAACERAAELAREAGDGVQLARIALARGIEFQFGAIDLVLVAMLREALAAMPPGDSSLRARCLARLAAAEQPAPDPREPIVRAREAIAMARRIDDRRTRLDVFHVAFAALIDYVPPHELDALLRELHVLATSPGDRLLALRDRLRHCFVALDLRDRAVFDAAVLVHAELAESLAMPRALWPVKMIAAMTALFEGRFADAEAAAAEATAIAAAAGDPACERALAFHRWNAAWMRTAPTAPWCPRVIELFPFARALVELIASIEANDLANAAALADVAEAFAAGDEATAAVMADAIAAMADRDRARRLYDRMSPAAGRVYVASMTGFAITDFADRALLVLAGVLDDRDAIDTHGRAAVTAAQRLGAAPWLARIQGDWATALDRLGEHARADALWHVARLGAERFAMPGLAERYRVARPGGTVAPAPGSIVSPASTTPAPAVSIGRDGELWIVRGHGCTGHIRDSRGIQMLARLVGEPGREVHALDLIGETGGVDTGDSGALLDPKAKAAYRKRLTELTQEQEEAEAWGDPVRAERAHAEIDALARELQRAVGIGGRDRKAGAASERARSNAQRRLSHAIQQIRAAAPALGDHFVVSIRTGTFCVYDPR